MKASELADRLRLLPPEYIRRVPPYIYNKPDSNDIPSIVKYRHGELIYKTPGINYYILNDVVVCHEGLVFTLAGQIIEESIRETPLATVEYYSTKLASGDLDIKVLPASNEVLLMKKFGATNYGHFIYEMAPLIYLINSFSVSSKFSVLAHDTNFKNITDQIFGIFGIDRRDVYYSGNDPVLVKRLLLVHGVTCHSIYASRLIQDFFDFISGPITPGRDKKIFVSRSLASTRRFLNSEEIEMYFSNNGYIIINPERLSFTDQMSIFKGANNVIGASGAALTNIVFCQPGSDIFCIMPENASEVLFWHLANLAKLRYFEWRVPTFGPQLGPLDWDRDMVIDIDKLDSIIKNYNTLIF